MKNLQLKVPDPCKEKWGDMTVNGKKSRLCHTCNTTIIDFASMNQQEVIDFWNNHDGSRVCGRVKPLPQPTKLHAIRKYKNHPFKFARVACSLLFGALFMTATSCDSNEHEGPVGIVPDPNDPTEYTEDVGKVLPVTHDTLTPEAEDSTHQ